MSDVLTMVHVMYKVRKVLQREQGWRYQRALFMRVGLPEGLSEAEFAFCVRMLEEQKWVIVDKGDRGKPMFIFNKNRVNEVYRSPEEIINHAMQCPPITEELLAGKA